MKFYFIIDHILRHKAGLNRYYKMEITPCVLSDHHRLKLDINNLGNKRQLKIRETEQFTPERNIDQENVKILEIRMKMNTLHTQTLKAVLRANSYHRVHFQKYKIKWRDLLTYQLASNLTACLKAQKTKKKKKNLKDGIDVIN